MTRAGALTPTEAAAFDRQRLHITSSIMRHGCAVVTVGTGQCAVPGCDCEPAPMPWAYSIGLAPRGHPEVVTFGLDGCCAATAINWLSAELSAGRTLELDDIAECHGLDVMLVEVPDAWLRADPSRMACWFDQYGAGPRPVSHPPVVQLVWADDSGRFPDDADCDPAVERAQPILLDDPYRWPPRAPRAERRRRR